MCFCGLIWLDELQIAIGLGGIEESEESGTEHGIPILLFLGGLVWLDWIGCRRAGVHAWLVTHFVLPVDGVLGYSWVSYFDLIWRHFRVFPVWKVSLFCLDSMRLVLSCLFGRGRFYRRFACASLGAVCCVGKADFYRAFILIPRHLFDSFFPAPFLSILSSSSSADTHCLFLLSGYDVQPRGQTMQCRI